MLSDKIIEKTAARYDPANVDPTAYGSALYGVRPKDPSLMATGAGVGGSVLAGKVLNSLGKAMKGRIGLYSRIAGLLAPVAPVAGGVWAVNRHLGAKSPEKAVKRARIMETGGPSWMGDPAASLTEYRNKLMDQERRLNKIIANRFQDRGDGTWLDTVHGRVINNRGRENVIGHLKLVADREKERWWADMASTLNSGRYVYDPITRTQKLVHESTGSVGDRDYEAFKNRLVRKAHARGGLTRALPYNINGTLVHGMSPGMTEEDIRRAYIDYMS